MPRRLALAACLAGASCFTGEALKGEPCSEPADCGLDLECGADGLCGEFKCQTSALSLPTFAPDITLIVAHTASMARLVDGRDITRWQQVLALVGELGEALGERVQLGLQVVPTQSAKTEQFPCNTDASTRLLPAPDQGAALLAALPDTAPTRGEHALRTGIDLALAGFALQDPEQLRPQALVLINDATLNCSDAATSLAEQVELFDDQLAARVAAAAAAGVPVFVVGVGITPTDGTLPFPGARWNEVDPHLAFNALAEAGGQPRPGATRYYRPEDSAALIAALAAVPSAYADCRVPLASDPAYDERLVVTIAGTAFRLTPDCAGGRGWRYVEAGEPPTVELCPETCADFRAARALTIEQRCPIL